MIGEDPSNSAALLSPDGNVVSRYNKMHLVPFGEYIPLKRLLFFAESFTKQVGNFAPGRNIRSARSTATAFQRRFATKHLPRPMRQFVKQGSEMFVLITNDGWFEVVGTLSIFGWVLYAPWRTGGIWCAMQTHRNQRHYRSFGRIESSTRIGVRTILDGTAHFRSDLTFYTRYGDVFAYANALAAVLAIAIAAKENHHARRTRRKIRST